MAKTLKYLQNSFIFSKSQANKGQIHSKTNFTCIYFLKTTLTQLTFACSKSSIETLETQANICWVKFTFKWKRWYIFAGKIWWVSSICSILNTINGVVSQVCSMALSIENMFRCVLPGYQNICNFQNDLQPVILILKIAAVVAIWEETISETCNLKLLLRYFWNDFNFLK